LARLGATAPDIPVGARRAPVWPAGIVGSISHDGDLAAAAVAWSSAYSGIGLDLASTEALETDLTPTICRPAEIERFGAEADPGRQAKLLFSIKEATYKALWPSVRQVLDFQDIEIVLDPTGARFAVVSWCDICPANVAARIVGRYVQDEDYMAAGAALLAP
jgi:4'-phosphopantetheinyl transferase EntD